MCECGCAMLHLESVFSWTVLAFPLVLKQGLLTPCNAPSASCLQSFQPIFLSLPLLLLQEYWAYRCLPHLVLYVGSRDKTQVIRIILQFLYPLSLQLQITFFPEIPVVYRDGSSLDPMSSAYSGQNTFAYRSSTQLDALGLGPCSFRKVPSL